MIRYIKNKDFNIRYNSLFNYHRTGSILNSYGNLVCNKIRRHNIISVVRPINQEFTSIKMIFAKCLDKY